MSAVEDKPYTGALAVISGATVIIALFTAVGVAALTGWAEQTEFAEKVESRPYVELHEIRESQHRRLASYGWVDREAGTVHVPIEKGIEMVLEENE